MLNTTKSHKAPNQQPSRSQRSKWFEEWFPGREEIVARVQYAMLLDDFGDDVTVHWYDPVSDDGEFRKTRSGHLTLRNVQASREVGKLFVTSDGKHYEVKSDFTNTELIECLKDTGDLNAFAYCLKILLEKAKQW